MKLNIVAKDCFISPNNSPVLLCCGSCCPGTSCRWHWAGSRQPSSSGPSYPSSSPPSPSLASASHPCVVGPWQIRIGEEWCLKSYLLDRVKRNISTYTPFSLWRNKFAQRKVCIFNSHKYIYTTSVCFLLPIICTTKP